MKLDMHFNKINYNTLFEPIEISIKNYNNKVNL